MRNSKRFLSIILAMIMMCSTLVVGANAAYTSYKDAGLTHYDSLDSAVLTTDQYASAALDEVDRMLNKEQLKFTRADIVVGDIDLTSIDAAMDSVYALVTGKLFSTFSGMLGDLKNLNANAFATVDKGGVRRTTAGKTDTDVLYAVLQFLYDNKGLITSFVNGSLDLGSIVSSLVDISEFSDVNKLLKGMLYKVTYEEEAPADTSSLSIDNMVQDIIDKYVLQFVPELEGKTNISTGSTYNFIDEALKTLYNTLLLDLLNDNVKYEINKFCGVVYTKDDAGNITNVDKSNLNAYASLLNIDYTIPAYTFTSGTFVDNINNIIKSIADAMINSSVYTWQAGNNSMILTNVINLAKAVLVNTGDDFFASYIKVATPAEVEAMDNQELVSYALRAIVNGSVHGMYIPESATTIREFGYYALSQLLATAVPELDFTSFDKNSTDTLVIMGIDYAMYYVNAIVDMDLTYAKSMTEVDQQITKAINYAIDNYGGLLNGITFSTSKTGWQNLNTLVFSLIQANWLPTAANSDIKTLIIDCLADNILDLDFDSIVSMLAYRSDSELQSSPKQVIINTVSRIVNVIFPNAIAPATSIDAIASNSALAATVGALFNDLQQYKVKLVASVLPIVCYFLNLTTPQEFKFPDITFDTMVYSSAGSVSYDIDVRNSSTGINTGYTDKNEAFHQDSLYTYDIKSVTSNVSGINLSNPGRISGGQTGAIKVTGSFSADTPFIITITYDVLTEDGTALTDSPITEYIYSYLSKSSDNDNTTKLTATSGNISITDGPLNVYASSMSDLYGMQLTVENKGSTQYQDLLPVTNALTAAKKLVTEDGKCYLKVKTDPVNLLPAVDGNNGIAKTYVLETTDEYNALTAEEKDAVWQSMIAKGMMVATNGAVVMYCKYTFTTGVKAGGVTASNAKHNVFLYDDYGLGSLLMAEMNKHRQASSYSSSSAWTAYTAAMTQAATAVYKPFKASAFAVANTSGKAFLYKPAYEALTAAIEALDATAVSQGVSSTQAIIDSLNPDNTDKEYDASDYTYFGISDYKSYTYNNYNDEYKSAMKMINAATIPNEETGEVQPVDDLTLAYTNHRLTLYGSRLLPVLATKQHLNYELTNAVPMADESKYSAESWANYIRAYNFATSVNAASVGTKSNPTLKQSKVNTAYSELLEAEKRLVADEAPVEEASFTIIDPSETIDDLYVTEIDDGLVLTGVQGFESFNGEEYFDCTGCHVEVELNEVDTFSTGATVNIINDDTDEIMATYLIAVTGDINGDSLVDGSDSTIAGLYADGFEEITDLQVIAGDVTLDEFIDISDVAVIDIVANGFLDMDFANRTVFE